MKIGNVNIENNIFLAPMAGVTDLAFRRICREWGAGLTYTEMVSAKGLYYKDKKTAELLARDEKETPSAAQIFGSEPDIIAASVEPALSYGADILDINMSVTSLPPTRKREIKREGKQFPFSFYSVYLRRKFLKQSDMETTTSLKTFEVTIPEKYADILKKFITSLEGKVKAQKKSGLDEALEDVKSGRIYHAESTKDLMKQILDCGNAISKEIGC